MTCWQTLIEQVFLDIRQIVGSSSKVGKIKTKEKKIKVPIAGVDSDI